MPFPSLHCQYNLYPEVPTDLTISISNPSAGVNKAAPPADLILSIISSKKCAEPVTSRFLVLIVSLLVMLLEITLLRLESPLTSMLLLKVASPLTFKLLTLPVPVTFKSPSAFTFFPSKSPLKIYLSLPENEAESPSTDMFKSPPSTSLPSVSNCLIIISPSVWILPVAVIEPTFYISPVTSFVPSKGCPHIL